VTINSNTLGAVGQPGLDGIEVTRNGAPGTAPVGGGLYTSGAPATGLRNTVLASNQLGNCAGTAPTDLRNNLSFGDASCPGGFATGDPRLGPLADNGGPTETVAIAPGSAALDEVPVADCLAVDQRGVTRPQGPDCDIGAFELASPAITTGAVTGLATTTATLHGSTAPNQASAQVTFQFGTTAAYGSSTPPQTVTGVQAEPVSAALTSLRPNTTYHFRLVATSVDGTTTGPDGTFKTQAAATTPPRLSSLKAKKAKQGKSATLTYTDSEAATTTFVVFRSSTGIKRGKRCVKRSETNSHGRRCSLLSKLGSFKHGDHAGANTVRLPARVGGRRLRAGTYVIRATPRLGSASGPTATAKLKL
jgi:hypothetical protein